MSEAATPIDEPRRLDALRALEVLDTAPEAEFDALVRVASIVCGVPISLISLVDHDRQWFKANIGLEGVAETDRSSSFCAHAIHGSEIFEIENTTLDDRFVDNPLVLGKPDIRFYAGVPLVLSDGSSVGSLCVIDRQPRRLDAQQREILVHLGRAAVRALEGRMAAIALHTSETRERQLREALEAEHKRRGDFLATLAHELRNPLSALKTGSSVLTLAKENPDTIDRISALIDRQVRHMARLVDDLSEASRVEAGKLEIKLARVSLKTLLATAVEASAVEIEQRAHSLDVRVSEGPVVVCVDAVRMAQVVSNLLVNAAKYTPRGGHIQLSASISGAALTLSVADDGVGIDAEALPTIFGMFVQIAPSTADRSGLGIGLALVKRIVSLHGGTVVATSGGAGQGSLFTVVLPTAVPSGAGPS